jgi:hypothetical protein
MGRRTRMPVLFQPTFFGVGPAPPDNLHLTRFLWKCRRLQFPTLIPPDQLNLLLGRVQDVLAMLNKKCPPLIPQQTLLQPNLALLDLGQDPLQLFEGFFKVFGGSVVLLVGHWKYYNRTGKLIRLAVRRVCLFER